MRRASREPDPFPAAAWDVADSLIGVDGELGALVELTVGSGRTLGRFRQGVVISTAMGRVAQPA